MASIKIKEPGEWFWRTFSTLFVCFFLIVSRLNLQMPLYRATVLPVRGCVADGVRDVPSPKHLHVSTAQEAAASLPSWHSVL